VVSTTPRLLAVLAGFSNGLCDIASDSTSRFCFQVGRVTPKVVSYLSRQRPEFVCRPVWDL
jgi:hypothetical protein